MSVQDALFLTIGAALLGVAFLLAWRRADAIASLFVIAGAALIVVLHPGVQSLRIDRNGLDLSKGIGREIAQQIGDISKTLNDHTNFLKQQGVLNKQNAEIITKNVPGTRPSISLPSNISQIKNESKINNYKISIYYKKDRRDAAYLLKDQLLQRGFRTSVLESDLSEYTELVDKAQRKEGWVHIGWANKGKEIVNDIEQLLQNTEINKVKWQINTHGDEWELRDTDIEIILY